MIDPTLKIWIPDETFKEAFTQSELGTWDECAFKWYLKYGHRIDAVGAYSFPQMFGTALHSSIADFYKTGDMGSCPLTVPDNTILSLEEEKKKEHWQIVLDATTEAYAAFFKDDLKLFKGYKQELEQVIEVEIEYKGVPIKLKGTLDHILIGKKDQLIIDTKSFTMMNDAQKESWQFRFQFFFYVWLAWMSPTFRQNSPARFMVNGIKKTQLRLNKGENLIQFKARIKKDILDDPGKYFWRDTMEFNQESIDRFEAELLNPKLDRIILLKGEAKLSKLSEGVWSNLHLAINKNTDACFNYSSVCPYLPICKSSFAENEDKYEQRKEKHPNYNEKVSDTP